MQTQQCRALRASRGTQCSRVMRTQRAMTVQAFAFTSDHNARVKGNLRQVYSYVSDFSNLASWYPGIVSVTPTRGAGKPLGIRSQFQIQQKIGGFNVATLYEVVDMQTDKKIVYSSGSELHTATHQLIFMPDPNDPTFTVVRYMSHVELTEWRKALGPVVKGVFNKLPEDGLKQLTSLLNSAKTPLRNMRLDQHAREAGASRTPGWNFTNMFNSLKSEMSQEARRSSSGSWTSSASQKIAAEPVADALGYYAALGLDGRTPRKVSADQIKTAFRKAAQTMHPDKFSMADEEERAQVEENFRKVQRAYEVLKDPETRAKYDSGKLQLEESLSA